MISKKIASEIAIGIILLFAIIIGVMFWLQNNKVGAPVNQQVADQIKNYQQIQNASQEENRTQICPDNFHRICGDGSYVDDCNQSCQTYDLNKLNLDTWTKYINKRIGFSMMIPKNNQINDNLYPVVVSEKNNDVTISTKNLPYSETPFVIKVRKAKSDEDINKWLASDFLGDNGCKIGRKDPSYQNGTFDVTIAADETCITNYAYVLRYDPERELVAFIMMGQDGHFYKESNDAGGSWLEGLDQEMVASLQFIDSENSGSFDKTALQNDVFDVVESSLKERYQQTKDPGYAHWDKKVDFTSVDSSLKAAKGKWWAGDAWDWIAWLQDDGTWKILLSFDGFDCKEIKNIPTQYNDFFKEIIYPVQRKTGMYSKEAYCI